MVVSSVFVLSRSTDAAKPLTLTGGVEYFGRTLAVVKPSPTAERGRRVTDFESSAH
jgi:hypothetical protein